MSLLNVKTFAIKRAYISANADSSTPAAWTEIPLTQEGTVEYSTQKSELQDGEGKLIHTWRYGQRARVMLRMSVFAFNILERITGSPVSSASGVDQISGGVEEEISPNLVRLKLVQRAVDNSGNEGELHVYIHKAQGEMPTVTMRQTTQGEFTINFDALSASFNELGAAIPSSYFRVDALKSAGS